MNKKNIPCKQNGVCLFEYGMTDRDIEGMPFPKSRWDKRTCPKYGHICPEFMEDFSLSAEDLKIRATIHCGLTAKEMVDGGKWKLEEMEKEQAKQIEDLLDRFKNIQDKYPPEQYSKYYDF